MQVIFDMMDFESSEYREHKEDLEDGEQQCDQEGNLVENFDDYAKPMPKSNGERRKI